MRIGRFGFAFGLGFGCRAWASSASPSCVQVCVRFGGLRVRTLRTGSRLGLGMQTEGGMGMSGGDVQAVEAEVGGNTGGGGRGRGKGKGAVRGGGGGGQNREVLISKALSKLLRHAAVDEGLKLDDEGFVGLDLVVSLRDFLCVFCLFFGGS